MEMYFALVLVVAFSSSANAQDLVVSVKPVHYDIRIVPNLEDLSFTATTKIAIVVEEETVKLTLNSKQLAYSNNIIIDGIETALVVESNEETISFNLSSPLSVGLHEITFAYSGKISETTQEGLYISRYTKTSGDQSPSKIALTNFQYDHARRVFPCYDHPDFPATFSINIVRPIGYISLSNVQKNAEIPINEETAEDGFAKTDVMPTYLVAFAIVDFDLRHNTDNFAIYSSAPEDLTLLTISSSRIGLKLDELYPQKLNKIVQIVFPDESLASDVVENIGLIFYRQSAVVYDEARGSVAQKQAVTETIAKAFCKQWYQYVIPSRFWQNLWLNEGFSAFYQYEVLNFLQPSWRLDEQFVVNELQQTLQDDEVEGLLLEVSSAAELPKGNFRSKAYALIRMSTNSKTLGDINNGDSIAHAWAKLKSFPVVTVSRVDGNGSIINLEQKSLDGSNRTVPINFATEASADFNNVELTHTLSERQAQIPVDASSWVIANKQQYGYYRVNYDSASWEVISAFLNGPNYAIIHTLNRAQLIDDAFHLAATEDGSYALYFELIGYVRQEEDFIALVPFFRSTNRLRHLLANTDTQSSLIAYFKNLADTFYSKVNINSVNRVNEPHTDSLKRTATLLWLSEFEHEETQVELNRILESKQVVDPDLEEAVFCGGMRRGNLATFEILVLQYRTSFKRAALKGIACTSNRDILDEYILAVFDQSSDIKLKSNDRLFAFFAILEGSDVGVDVALHGLKQHWDLVLQLFTDSQIEEMVVALAKRITNEEQEVIVDAIIACLEESGALHLESLFQLGKKHIQTNREWIVSYQGIIQEEIGNVLTTQDPSTTKKSTTSKVSTIRSTTIETTTIGSTPPGGSAVQYTFTGISICIVTCCVCLNILT